MHDNEFIIEGKRFIKNIRKCTCLRKTGELYLLDCKIIQRGKKWYNYSPVNKYLADVCCDKESKRLWLIDNSKEIVESEVNAVNNRIEKAETNGYQYDNLSSGGFALYYERRSHSHFDAIIKRKSESCDIEYKIITEYPLDDMLRENTREKTLSLNPFYIAAQKNNDIELQKQIKLHYGLATVKECSWLSRLFGYKILPSLPEEYNKEYYVDSGTVSIELLKRSGYQIWHRPYFGMKNSTHSIWSLNPYTKDGTDAAPQDAVSIPFKDYVKMIESFYEDGNAE